LLRAECPFVNVDRYLAPDIERATALVKHGALSRVFRNLPNASTLPALWIPV
jgi:histidine ammonia-lyase